MPASPLRSLKNSCNGLYMAWRDDRSFRNAAIQVLIGLVLATVIAAVWRIGPLYWLVLVASLFPILIVETLNTAIEAVTDKASPERHPLAKKAKDIGSAAVLITRIMALMCWLAVFFARNII
jgi:diacylglycerol kinase (ATP)